LGASSQGSAHPDNSPDLDTQGAQRVAPGRRAGASSSRSRRAPQAGRPPGRRDSTRPAALTPVRPALRRQLPVDAWARVACWWTAGRWVGHVEAVYRRHYLLTRGELVARTGGGISLPTVLAVARAHAVAADHRTGRACRPLLGASHSPHGVTGVTGLGKRTVQRARTWLRLVGLATEVAPGRHRTYLERMDSWRRGDTARGWTADYALHPSATHPVDNPAGVGAGQTPHGTPPHSGISTTTPSDDLVVTTTAQNGNGRAPRAATTKTAAKTRARRVAPDARGLLLATRWRSHPDTPAWARKNTPTAWAGLLASPASHGWTARDLNQLLDDHTATHGQLLTHPRRPIGYLSWLLSHADLGERPCALDDARAAAEAADAAQRKTAQAAAAVQHNADRQVAQAALGGVGHTAARTALPAALRRRGERA